MNPAKPLGQRLLAYALCALLACPLPLRAAEPPTDISDGVVAQPATTSMKPNLLLILDDSGSMARQFTPDYVNTFTIPSGTVIAKNCFDSFDAGTANGSGSANVINNTPDECWAGDPPAMSPEFNVQYYNPTIRYRPAVDYGGTERDSMTCDKTGGNKVTAITVGATTLITVTSDVTAGSSLVLVGFQGADASVLNNQAFTVSAYNSVSKVATVGANTTGKTITVGTPAPCAGGSWTAVLSDNVSPSNIDYSRKDLTGNQGGPGSAAGNWGNDASPVKDNFDITTEWPDRVWCKTVGASATDTALCKTNSSSYRYPDAEFAFGLDASSDRKYRFGAPYYYRINTTTYCTDARMNDCRLLCDADGLPAGCIVSTVAPDNVVGGKSYAVESPVRFCTDSTLTDCYAKRSPSRQYASFLGSVASSVTLNPPVPATATITIGTQADAAKGTISSIKAIKPDGTFIDLAGAQFDLNPGSTCSWAETIEGKIDARTGTTGFLADHPNCGSSNVVTIKGPSGLSTDPVPAGNFVGLTLEVATVVSATTPASVTLTFSNTVQNSACTGSPLSCANFQNLIIGGTNFAPTLVKCNTAACNTSGGSGNTAKNTRDKEMATLVHAALVLPTGWTKGLTTTTASGNPYPPTSSPNRITITAPSGLPPTGQGSDLNGTSVSIGSLEKTTVAVSGSGKLSGGTTTGDVTYTKTNFTDGQNESVSGALVRNNVGNFERVNILPGQTYNKYSERTDCVEQASVCTYAEEMTNFANWVSYYRTRLQMAKTAIGRAFALAGISTNFRVGFTTINFSSSRNLAVAPFTTGAGGQQDLWFQQLYGSIASGSTPLIGALSRAGRYYADGFNGAAGTMGSSPINSACQPSYTIVTSDGYWNDGSNPAKKENGSSSIGDCDGDGVSNTLADVACYYYNTDLRQIPPLSPSTVGYKDQVPPSGEDTAPHQHMTTFSVGLGVSGSLLFHPNYKTPGNSVDYDTIVGVPGTPGTNAWPTPVANTETTIDDMWHAAVNGKGQFFSAQNPVALAAGINEVLAAVAKRIGAGAAAATSNLQPVAGDNFAFTAQYQTGEWSGDLKARTISLTDGVIGNRELWSAQSQLDLRSFGDRVIYTFDPDDTDATLTVDVDGVTRSQNANKLRGFCRPDAPAGTYPTCDDGGLLTPTEISDNFNPLGGPNGALAQAGGWGTSDPRRANANTTYHTYLIRFLRGERAKEMTLGGTTGNDLWRTRTHILGDIVNAQPAYVKGSPFSYGAATDPFYKTFQDSTNGQSATRKGTVYVAANDGMLHAFETDPDNIPYYQNKGVSSLADATDDEFTGTLDTDPVTGEGAERWAYVPTLIFPTMKRLAEQDYKTQHKYFVDGSPAIGDVCFDHTLSVQCTAATKWRTILVGGLNNGGRGYYALDITDPDNPKGLWEVGGGNNAVVSGSVKCLTDTEANSGSFGADCNIGYTFGNPVIAKRPVDGKWVVLFTSGYNNFSPGNGVGYLYMVDAKTGKILRRMSTGVGCADGDADFPCAPGVNDPSGLARINAWVDSATTDNTAKQVYGGDLKGNLWRFQLDNTATVPRYSVTRLATVEDDSHAKQPITARPELALAKGKHVVYIGTGKFLGDTDKTDLQKQSIYAIKDDLTDTAAPQVSMVRTGPGLITDFVKQTLSEDTTSTRTVATPQNVNLAGSDKGWFIDLPDGGTGEEAAERVSVDPIIQLGTLVVPSNVPSTETCLAGGSGWVNFLDITSGAPITGTTANPASVKISGSLIVGINLIKIGDQIKTIVTTADNQQLTKDTPVAAAGVQGRRVSWRELIVE